MSITFLSVSLQDPFPVENANRKKQTAPFLMYITLPQQKVCLCWRPFPFCRDIASSVRKDAKSCQFCLTNLIHIGGKMCEINHGTLPRLFGKENANIFQGCRYE